MQTQKHSKDFSQIYKTVLHDKTLGAFDRGLLITLYNLPDDWKFSVSGLCSILPDGKSAISGSLRRLEDKGYLRLTKARNEKGLSIITDILKWVVLVNNIILIANQNAPYF